MIIIFIACLPLLFARILDQNTTSCYGVIFDAGSTGTRVHVYSWACKNDSDTPIINISSHSVQSKINPGLQTFENNIDGIEQYLSPLLEFAKSNIPPSLYQQTPIMMGATAGMRLVQNSKHQRDNIMIKVQQIFKKSGFKFIKEQWAKVISGSEEGIFMWLSINYLLGLLKSNKESTNNTIVAIDLGGASTQIAFIPFKSDNMKDHFPLSIPSLPLYDVYTVSYLEYGNDMARNNILQSLVNQTTKKIISPCHPKNYRYFWDKDTDIIINGTGDPEKCLELIYNYFNVSCNDSCGINGKYQPKIDENQTIYAVNGITIAKNKFVNKEDQFLVKDLKIKSSEFCSQTWDVIRLDENYMKDKYIGSNCFLGLYSYALLTKAFSIDENVQIKSPELINGISPSWTMANMLYWLSLFKLTNDDN